MLRFAFAWGTASFDVTRYSYCYSYSYSYNTGSCTNSREGDHGYKVGTDNNDCTLLLVELRTN